MYATLHSLLEKLDANNGINYRLKTLYLAYR